MLPMIFAIAVLARTLPGSPETAVGAAQVSSGGRKKPGVPEKDGLEWETTKCVSCHHGPWMMWSGYEAKKRGFNVNEKSLAQVVNTSRLRCNLGCIP